MPHLVLVSHLQDSKFRAVGAPTEAALIVLSEKLGLPDAAASKDARKKRVATKEEHPMPVTKVSICCLLCMEDFVLRTP